ncbi:MAG: DinB family protein [Acidobacteriota bacterium]
MLAAELAALYERDLIRLSQQIAAFPDTASLWRTLPGVANSAGNLALHLEGNLREYIGRQLGGVDYTRQRPLEFSQTGLTADDLLSRIHHTRQVVTPVIAGLSPEALDGIFPEPVLGTPITSRQFLVHLNGHLNYHLGQIDYLRRALTGAGAIALAGL